MKNRIRVLLCVAVIVICAITLVFAFPSNVNLNVPNVTQQDTLLCWAASSVSCLQYNGWTTSQTDFVAAVKGGYCK